MERMKSLNYMLCRYAQYHSATGNRGRRDYSIDGGLMQKA